MSLHPSCQEIPGKSCRIRAAFVRFPTCARFNVSIQPIRAGLLSFCRADLRGASEGAASLRMRNREAFLKVVEPSGRCGHPNARDLYRPANDNKQKRSSSPSVWNRSEASRQAGNDTVRVSAYAHGQSSSCLGYAFMVG
ncbi:hypothetical protein [Bradyrhizobium uaiense]|uniref:Uncharacterized protein n=1 Tax=Bradyrhizobium uaiense TaxID=2594946 RepID=A0A6P1BA73_9BRAD|nr:hypothetical protein [Bradyrhizobium uaiense]NEU94332.1 hypothetical protein [Bradyrhizobium uaiense]